MHSIGNQEPRVVLTVEGNLIDFLLDTGATFSVLRSGLGGPLSSQTVTVKGVSGIPQVRRFTKPLSCVWNDLMFN